ncbi:FliM/FliN family flagellar motor switch protein [Martelella sp. HB161492]|uniref:FliM/FliN family flagellar motor switch protein n=1 Tax=Martelella sp. HB161492 TaxID=2720726 RepID=UPI0015915787|nr:FliM/FliN family flagellar motor switch protein [Martelella sp. HB161492]
MPSIDPAATLLLNRLSARQWQLPIKGSLEDLLAIMVAFKPWHRQGVGPFTTLTMNCNAGRFTLLIESKFCDLIGDIMLPAWREEKRENLPTRWRLVLSFEYWLKELGLIDTIHNLQIGSQDTDPTPKGAGPYIAFQFIVEEHKFLGLINIEQLNPETLSFLDQIPPVAMLGTFTPDFACRITLPHIVLPASEWRRIGPGDLIRMVPLSDEGISASVHIHGAGTATALIDEDGIVTLNEAPREMTPMEDEDDFALDDGMEPEEMDFGDGGPAMQETEDALGELPIRIDVQLAETRVSLAELQTLGPGATLPLGGQLTDLVTIRANGRAMASGYLVIVDGELAVQIHSWPGKRPKGD